MINNKKLTNNTVSKIIRLSMAGSALALSVTIMSGCSIFDSAHKPKLQQTTHTHQYMTDNDFKTIHRLARDGNANAQYNLGYRYYYGIGVQENIKRAKSWFFRSASKGNHLAKQALRDIKRWEGDHSEEDASITYHTPRPAYLPPPPTNRDKFADELAPE